MATARSRRPPAATLARRWFAVIAIGLVAYAYYHPLRTWIEKRHELGARRAEVAQLVQTKHELEQRVTAATTDAALAREARRLGYIRPGEHLFIVKGIAAWRAAHTIGGGER